MGNTNGAMPQNRIGPLRKAKGLTLEQLAERSGLSVAYLSRLQSGERMLSVPNAERIARALEVSTTEVLGLEGPNGDPVTGFAEDDLQPYEAGPSETQLRASADNRYLMTVTTNAVENLGIRVGDVVEIDSSAAICKSPPPLSAVLVQYHPDADKPMAAVTLLRQFVPPTKLITNAANLEGPPLDLSRDDAQILGVVTWAHRRFG